MCIKADGTCLMLLMPSLVLSKQVASSGAATRDECEEKAAKSKRWYYAYSASTKLCQVTSSCEKTESKVDWVVYQLCVMPDTTRPPFTGKIVSDFKFKSKVCSAEDMCNIENAAECGKAATELRLSDTTATDVDIPKALGGCYMDGSALVFNSRVANSKNKKQPSDSDQVICKPCPYVSPYRYCIGDKVKAKCKVSSDCTLLWISVKTQIPCFAGSGIKVWFQKCPRMRVGSRKSEQTILRLLQYKRRLVSNG